MGIYSQPAEYHFSQDSVELVSWALKVLPLPENMTLKVLDAGAGCGILGKEWLLKRVNDHVCFVEKQDIFKSHLEKNLNHFSNEQRRIIIDDLINLPSTLMYDYVISNPPYFLIEEGRLPSCNTKKECRHISRDELDQFFASIHRHLKGSGILFFCFRHVELLYNVKEGWKELYKSSFNNYHFYCWQKNVEAI